MFTLHMGRIAVVLLECNCYLFRLHGIYVLLTRCDTAFWRVFHGITHGHFPEQLFARGAVAAVPVCVLPNPKILANKPFPSEYDFDGR